MTASFIAVCGFPAEGDVVEPTAEAARWLIAGGWKPPRPRQADGKPTSFDIWKLRNTYSKP